LEVPNELTEKLRKAAILNAIRHNGKADPGAVLGNLLGQTPELRAKARELAASVRAVVEEINLLSYEKLMSIATESWPEELVRERPEEERKLPPLPNADKYAVIVTRIAPNPDFVLHIGNARAVILSHDYARMYNGRFIVRFEDTDPRLKKAQLRYYDIIREDLKWLGCNGDEEYIQSDRIPLYYEVAERLFTKGAAYVCECQPERFRELVNSNSPCPDRDLTLDEQKKRWRKMLEGGYKEGEAVVRIKTDLAHPNPAIRDWPAFRIIDTTKNPHPRVGSKFRVWPLYNLASGVDDHTLGITHIIRGKEHLTNMARQTYMYNHLGWKYPDAVHYGRLKVEGMELSKSKLMKGVESGEFQDVDDPRLGTLAALRRRGYSPETIRQLIWDVGPKPVDVTISWDNINSLNRKIIDPTSHRYYFVPDPIRTSVTGVQRSFEVHAALHPQHPEMGSRTLKVQPKNGEATIFLAGSDKPTLESNKPVRLMGLFNIEPLHLASGELQARFLSETAGSPESLPILQWVPGGQTVPANIIMPDATTKSGFVEDGIRAEDVGSIIQFVRFGFGRVDKLTENSVTCYFAHQ
jgi:glutamyl-tRNA synthetase